MTRLAAIGTGPLTLSVEASRAWLNPDSGELWTACELVNVFVGLAVKVSDKN